MIFATVYVFLLLNADCCGLRFRFFLPERVVQFSTGSVSAIRSWLRLEVNPAELDIELVTRAGPIESAGADGLFFACLTRPSCCRVMR
jgi:hypothetical protein